MLQCHRKLELALESQHARLQNTLEELRAYQAQHSTWVSLSAKLATVQASLESRVGHFLSSRPANRNTTRRSLVGPTTIDLNF